MENDMNKVVISMFAVTLATGITSADAFAKTRKHVRTANLAMNTSYLPSTDSRKVDFDLREQHRLDEKNGSRG
jgi:hypothetical protein